MSSQLAVGFDLDMTLIDTVPGFAATLRALGEELGVEFPVEELTSKLGPPLEQMLAPHLPADQVDPAGDRFRALYLNTPSRRTGAAGRARGARGGARAARPRRDRDRQVPANAQRHVDHLGLDVDVLEGWVWGSARRRCSGARASASTSATTSTTSRVPVPPAR